MDPYTGSGHIQALLAHHSSSVKPQSTHSMPERNLCTTDFSLDLKTLLMLHFICVHQSAKRHGILTGMTKCNGHTLFPTPQRSRLPGCNLNLLKSNHSNRPGTDQLPQPFSGSQPAATVSRRQQRAWGLVSVPTAVGTHFRAHSCGYLFPCPQLWRLVSVPTALATHSNSCRTTEAEMRAV